MKYMECPSMMKGNYNMCLCLKNGLNNCRTKNHQLYSHWILTA